MVDPQLEPGMIQTDNGSEFGSQFHWRLPDKGIGHVYITKKLYSMV